MNPHRSIDTPTMVSVYDGRTCLGFMMRRNDAYEFTAAEQSLGIFRDQRSAANAISEATP
jgi:hypothetical protein